MRKARHRNPTRKRQSKLLRELLRPQFTTQLDRDLNPRRRLETGHPAFAQASASLPAGSTHDVDTLSHSTIASTTPFSLGFSEDPFAGTYQPPEAGGQPVPSPGFNLYPLSTTLGYHAQRPTTETLNIMDPNDIDGHGYLPHDYTQGTPDVDFGTIDTWAQSSSLSAGVWSTQGQHDTNRSSVQTPSNTNTFSRQAWEQQVQPTFDLASVRVQSIRIRRPNQQQWTSIDVFFNPNMQRSYLTQGVVEEADWSLDDLEAFAPGNHGQAWAQDGGLAPTCWVAVDIVGDGIFSFPQTREHIAIHPLPQPPGTNAGLIMGSELWQKLYQQQGGGTAPAFQPFNN